MYVCMYVLHISTCKIMHIDAKQFLSTLSLNARNGLFPTKICERLTDFSKCSFSLKVKLLHRYA